MFPHRIWKRGRAADLLLFTCLLVITRVAFRSHYLYDIDSVNLALGLRRFDPVSHQPHPPGYFLYICLGRVVDRLFHDANATLIAISITSSCGALAAIYVLAEDWFGKRAAFFSALIFLVSPLVWFHGTVALTYAVELFFSALTGYLCWRVYYGSERLVYPAAITVGLAAGFRPSFLVFLMPLALFSLIFSRTREIRTRAAPAAGVLAVTLAAWFLPMIRQSGGAEAYTSALLSLWRTVPGTQTVFNSSPGTSAARLVSVAGIAVLCFGCVSLLIFRRDRGPAPPDSGRKLFTAVWTVPGLLFFVLIFLKFVNSGYLLVISPPAFIWFGLRASNWYEDLRLSPFPKIAFGASLIGLNTAIFLFAPVYCSYRSVRHFESELREIIGAAPGIASPKDTLIVGFDSHFLGYRHAGYYLPGWYTAQYPEVRLASGPRVFTMTLGDTHVVEKLPWSRYRRFLFFPLPSGDREYSEYMARIYARFPGGSLQKTVVNGREYIFGRITDLPLLFPNAAGKLYTGGHASADAVHTR